MLGHYQCSTVDVLRYFDEVAVGVAEINRAHRSDGAPSRHRAGRNGYILGAQMGEHLFQRNRRDETEVARAECWNLRFVGGIGGAVLKIDLLIAEAQRIARLPARPLKIFPFESENPFVEPCGFFDIVDHEVKDEGVAALTSRHRIEGVSVRPFFPSVGNV